MSGLNPTALTVSIVGAFSVRKHFTMKIEIKNRMLRIDFLKYHIIVAFTLLQKNAFKKWTVKKGFYVNTYKIYPLEVSIYY